MKLNLDYGTLGKDPGYVPLTRTEEVLRFFDKNSELFIGIAITLAVVALAVVVWRSRWFNKLGAPDIGLLIFSVLALILEPLVAWYHDNNILEAVLYSISIVVAIYALRLAYHLGQRSSDGRK